ncbi:MULTISPECIES: FHA domain-containing protein [unclassified Microbacterium]|uniref:FHA domain-containing protein n=1 Tax=unclassified Microbacterium TaxID=2609290 RepID=UPI000F54E08F|nr:FHA domain-containing protein [Microbacterium sp. ABRD28]AZC12562.1 FHA domain-containing protein [Microbacterium sp. ABRD28]
MTTQDSLRLADVDPLVLTARARAGQLAGAIFIDLAAPLVAAIGGILALVTGAPALGTALLVISAILVAVTAWQFARSGRALGGLAVGLRTVKAPTGAAAGRSFLPALLRGQLETFDLRRGRDPFAPALAPVTFPQAPAPTPRPRSAARGGVPLVRLDSGERLSLESALILGRTPTAPADAPAEAFQWPDLSRSLSKSHARLEWDGARLWVTDLGSTNGTFIRTAGNRHPLIAHQRTPLPLPAEIDLGDRSLSVTEAR